MKKILKVFLAVFMMIAGITASPVRAEDEIVSLDAADFRTVEVLNTHVYTYTASQLNNPTPMMTPYFFVWNNDGYDNETEAWQTLVETGLVNLAEEVKGCVVLLDPIADDWSSEDVNVYNEIINSLAMAGNAYGPQTYENLMYAIGEGAGASFVNDYMSKNAHRLAGALVLGGDIQETTKKMSLPTYLVNADEDVVNYYKGINNVDSETKIQGETCYYNSKLTIEKVIVDSAESDKLTAEMINSAWNLLFRVTTRNIIEKCLWADPYGFPSGGNLEPVTEVFTLMSRTTPESVDLIFNEEETAETVSGYWFEWIPEEALAELNEKTYPLVINLHGSGDHPVFEVECNGWVDVAGEERLIVASLEWQINGGNSSADNVKALIEELCNKYPVDESRIYVTGFSAGSGATLNIGSAYPEMLAAIAPLAVPTDGSKLNVTEDQYASFDLPVFFGTGTMDMYTSADFNMGLIFGGGNPADSWTYWGHLNPKRIENVVNVALGLNEIETIDMSSPDYETYPYYGFDINDATSTYTYTSAHGLDIDVTSYANDKGIDMVRMFIVHGMEHNHYTEFAVNAWDFFEDFARNPETKELVYVGPVENEAGGKMFELSETTNRVFTYVPSDMYDPTPMMTPVIFVYPDNDLASATDAYAYLEEAGLIALAEKEKAGLFVLNSVGDDWSEKDLETYKELQTLLAAPTKEFGYVSYQNLMYAVGEGSGATYINNILSQNANRIAAVLTFGGEIDNPENKMPLPAYLSNASDKAVDFYKEINKTDREKVLTGDTVYYNSAFDVQQVIVDATGADTMNQETIQKAWDSLLRVTARNIMERCVWAETYGMESGGLPGNIPADEIFTLMDRPTPESVGLVEFEEVSDEVSGFPGYWFEWVPEEALDENNTEEFALVMVYHGSGDHPVFEVEGNGWVEIAGQERLILVSPEYQINTTGQVTPESHKALIDYICEKYPVDKERIYATGFSMGGMTTNSMGSAYADTFAAIAPLADPFGTLNTNGVELPTLFGTGTMDMYTTTALDEEDHTIRGLAARRISGVLNNAFAANGIDFNVDTETLDYAKYPWYGFDVEKYTESYVTPQGWNVNVSSWENGEGVETVKMMTIEGMEHNHYTSFAPEIWSFFKNFTRDTETKESVYVPVEPETPDTPVVPDVPVKPGQPTETGDFTVIAPYAILAVSAAGAFVALRRKED